MDTADPLVTYAGWAYKEGSLVKSWKKRFLVVKRRELAYYKTTNADLRHAQIMGGMRIARVERAPNITNGLVIHSLEGRVLRIFMDTPQECDKCFNAIAEWCHTSTRRQSTHHTGASARRGSHHDRTLASSAAQTPQPSQRPPQSAQSRAPADRHQHTGWLELQGGLVPMWKMRYFVLDGDLLSYSIEPTSEILGCHRVLGVRRDRTKAFTLGITVDTGKELRVSADNEFDLIEWQKHFHEAIHAQPSSSRAPVQLPQGGSEEFYLFGSAPMGATGGTRDAGSSDHPPHPAEGDDLRGTFAFSRNIQLDHDGANPSFIECDAAEDSTTATKPFSPKAPGTDTIRRMRIELHLLEDEDDVEDAATTGDVTHAVASTRSEQLHKHALHATPAESAQLGPCCCVIM